LSIIDLKFVVFQEFFQESSDNIIIYTFSEAYWLRKISNHENGIFCFSRKDGVLVCGNKKREFPFFFFSCSLFKGK